ncbi:MAG: antibiotic biosynthesis monooxygenase [Pseudanabaena sp.]|jgi:antibiotic biosynthesis monooxygenase (ABM) superfamily enzyme|nr:antibiotic biosynthesis monooxygenase [Pseudanabaena sp. M125S2SP2A07QC]MCA6537111.1 antibiotic biosynthesis monooxygenase [Pseudanabaena sp. M176S2SP2A07QC]MCA6541083.1 antibiotic biosynthesis monooxygenase [Pseudanabaena sp. M037S2SP2A07QC]MCA6543600.1 antibiotic biosynthesis monooxygenase [Pseudanabaena sp. M074S1SP2A07QC]MCA6550211.1 antibiotic biosynthesis monooxygenase [Pseudanabaena sp. M152S2SP2A07QC]MCA6554290.1 antibiotic biosynthesis monooxygenase [Pseudanabaena sp. M135S2SP2A07Q
MQKLGQHSDPITLVISEVVEPYLIEEYETWTKGINQSVQQFEGFMGVEIIRPRDHQYPEYVVIVKFDNYAHCKNWLASSVYQQWMQRSEEFISNRSQQHQQNGLELWFSLPKSKSVNPPEPPYYKQVIIGVITVYPLILLSNLLVAPLLQGLPALLSLLISVTFTCALLSYPVMPYITKILAFWLYPSNQKRSKKKRK